MKYLPIKLIEGWHGQLVARVAQQQEAANGNSGDTSATRFFRSTRERGVQYKKVLKKLQHM